MVRQLNFSNDVQNRAAHTISAAMYERRALDCTSILPLIVTLNNLAYLVANNRKIRDLVCTDGGLERLLRILRTVPKNSQHTRGARAQADGLLPMWKWTTAFQCMVHLCIRGGVLVRERAVEAGIVPILVKVLESYLCFSDAHRLDKKRLLDERKKAAEKHKPTIDRRRQQPNSDLRQQYQIDAAAAGNSIPRLDQRSVQQAPPDALTPPPRRPPPAMDVAERASAQVATAFAHPPALAQGQRYDPRVNTAPPQQPPPNVEADPALGFQVPQAHPASGIQSTLPTSSNAPSTALDPLVTTHQSRSQNSSTATSRGSSSRTSSFHSQDSAGNHSSSSRIATSASAIGSVESSGLAQSSRPSSRPQSGNSSGSIAASIPSHDQIGASHSMRPSRTPSHVGSSEHLPEAGSASGSEGVEDAEMSADGEESEADAPESSTYRSRHSDFVRDVVAAAARVEDQSDDDVEERRTPRATRRALAPLAFAQAPTATEAQAGASGDWTIQETPRAPAMSSRSHTITPRERSQATVERGASSRHSNTSAGNSDYTLTPQYPQTAASSSHHHHHHSRHRNGTSRVHPVLPTTYIAETFDPSDMAFREEEVLLSLQILAYLTKYSHIRALLRFPEMTRASNLADLDELWEKAYTSPGTPMWQEGERFQRSIYTIAERYTCRATRRDPHAEYIAGGHKLAPLIQYWAAVVMRNACRKDDRENDPRSGLRQCGNMLCGKWEKEPREFAKCRRCKKAKFCSKVCQSTSWQIGHKYWCSSTTEAGNNNDPQDSSSRPHHHSNEQHNRRGSGTLAVEPTTVSDGTLAAPQEAPVDATNTTATGVDFGREEPQPNVAQPSDSLAADTLATPRLASHPSSGLSRSARADVLPQRPTATSRDEPVSMQRVEQRNRLPSQRPPGSMASAIPARIASEATSVGAMSDMSEDESEQSGRIPPSDNELSESEHGSIRGPPAPPVRTDIAGRPLPPPVIAGTGMDLSVGAAMNGGVGIDADDSFGERFVENLDAQFGQGNIDQITWRGQTPTQGMEDESMASPTRELFHRQSSSNNTTEADTDGEEAAMHRRRGTVTQAGYARRAGPSGFGEGREQLRSVSSTIQAGTQDDHFGVPAPGVGLPSGRPVNGFRSASTMHSVEESSASGSGSFGNAVRRMPSSHLPSTEQERMWNMPRSEYRAPQDGTLPLWVDDATHDNMLRHRGALPGHPRAMNHHQHLLMRGDIAAGMMGRSTTPNPDPTAGPIGAAGAPSGSGSWYVGASSTLSSPAGRSEDRRLVADVGLGDDQRTPLSERSDPMQMIEDVTRSGVSEGDEMAGQQHQQWLQQAPGFAQWMTPQARPSASASNSFGPQQSEYSERRSHADPLNQSVTSSRMGQAHSLSRMPWNSTEASRNGAEAPAAFWNMLQENDGNLQQSPERQHTGRTRRAAAEDVEMSDA